MLFFRELLFGSLYLFFCNLYNEYFISSIFFSSNPNSWRPEKTSKHSSLHCLIPFQTFFQTTTIITHVCQETVAKSYEASQSSSSSSGKPSPHYVTSSPILDFDDDLVEGSKQVIVLHIYFQISLKIFIVV